MIEIARRGAKAVGAIGEEDGICFFRRAGGREEARGKRLSRLQVSPHIISHKQGIDLAQIGSVWELYGLERRVLA